jgi:hypothetical protein
MPIRPELRKFYQTPEWKAARIAVRERAGDRCEQCGKLNGQREMRWAKNGDADGTTVIQCGCAHLNGVAGDDRDENLAWLCRRCHLHHDRPFHRNTRAARKDAARPLFTEFVKEATQ